MTDDQLRALVRESVARHLGLHAGLQTGLQVGAAAPSAAAPVSLRMHPSHYRYQSLHRGSEGEAAGPCIIEPAVICNHCGYCQSHGH